MNPDFGARIRKVLARRRMTSASLARELGRPRSAVSHWLTGTRECPVEVVTEIARILKVNREWLLQGDAAIAETDQTGALMTRVAVQQEVDWQFREAPRDGGRDFGNANAYATPPTVETLAREIGQNTMDAARRLGASVSPVAMRYSLIELTKGSEGHRRFLDALRFDTLERHIQRAALDNAGRSKLGAKLRDGLAAFKEEKRVLLLRIDDYGTIGLSGDEPDEQDENQLSSSPYTALVRNNLDSSKADSTAGGAYGLGKAVLWNCSGISTVLFASRIPDEKRGIRVTGRTELTWHRDGSTKYAGPGWFGLPPIGHSVWTQDANYLRDLCLDRSDRLPTGVSERNSWGTSALVLGFRDPEGEGIEEAAKLLDRIADAAATNFFPAIIDKKLAVFVDHIVDGVVRSQRQVAPEEVVPEFCEALKTHYADEVTDALDEHQSGGTMRAVITHRIPGTRQDSVGVESFEEVDAKAYLLIRYDEDVNEGSSSELSSSVALVRGRGMVVRFLNREGIAMGAKPFHAIVLAGEGVSLDRAQRAAEQFLRLAEPPAHDDWEYRQEVKVAYKIGAKSRLRDFRVAIDKALQAALKPKVEGSEDGPEELKRLLQIGQISDPKPTLATLRDVEASVVDGRWQIAAKIHFNERNATLKVTPRAWIDVESGAAIRLPWDTLEFYKGSTQLPSENGSISATRSRPILLQGKTVAEVDGIHASQCRAKLDLLVAALSGEEA